MAGFRITGMASGLPPNIVEQLMEAERIPVKQMEVGRAKQEDKLKLVQDLETKVNDITKNLGELTSTSGFVDKKFLSGDPNIVDGQVDPGSAIPGDYAIEVVQLAQKPAAMSNGFPDKDQTQIGVGYIKFETPEGTKEVYINGSNSTLDGVMKQINAANVGLKAQVVEDRKDQENPFKLLVSGLSTGNDSQVTFPKIYLLDGDQDMYFEESRKAQNAKVKVDGFEIELPDNKSTDLVPGVTLDFKSAAPGREIRLSVKENLEVISGKIKSFVDSYNAALEFIQKQNKLQAGNGKNPALGPLGGDGMLRSIENSLRRVILNPQMGVESPIRRVGELGIEFNRNGTLNFSQDKFNKVLQANPKAVAAFLRGDGFNTGFVSTVKREIGNLVNGQFGTISNRKRGLEDRIKQVNNRIETKERQLERKEDSLRRKFADLEQKMSALNAQQAKFAAMSQPQG
ncbi:flagellar filament capping protein FliD [Bdellovibrio bacteriovorus]|uniref:Flagellar hook-associated protein 2 n=2 Tax=Bdellovibrio bacteriovorus TaxID=959 RepID=Q6MQ71_BDEBA|nr:flagellar filament capping protein FliD [Bdellovibrio bacteriovorus]AHZ86689.1 flagellar hook associated protein [Bdellovibrio bacteriovorus]BEV67129.1 B-type flagellar hook-associated protein 2 [Bdellovibrio bacteriovorus]CAE78576.1 flagellar hook associated protein [Bdellovibrio bacteriovorus HD100]